MDIFYIALEVRPTQRNTHGKNVEGAIAHCWVYEESAPAAYNKAWFFVRRDEWEVTTSSAPFEIAEDFLHGDLGQEQFAKAKRQSFAIYYAAWSRDGYTVVEPTVMERSHLWDVNRFVRAQGKAKATGHCLHFDNDGQCKHFVNAHSIQKSGLLREISKDGHVYVPSSDIGMLRKNGGKIILQRRGIQKVSTFRGLCTQHDSELFKPIDIAPLYPTGHQVILYAYRSLCRELFVKENALSIASEQVAQEPKDRGTLMLFENFRSGTSFGLEQLRLNKAHFDETLRLNSYDDVEYTIFTCKHKPVHAFSGLFYPEFDFTGRKLQNLADRSSQLDLLTVCAANMRDGWGFLFAWHKTSSGACRAFLQSLATVVHDGRRAEEALFSIILGTCENFAIAPKWWEALTENQREQVCSALYPGSSPFAPSSPDYLAARLEDLVDWEFDGVLQSGWPS